MTWGGAFADLEAVAELLDPPEGCARDGPATGAEAVADVLGVFTDLAGRSFFAAVGRDTGVGTSLARSLPLTDPDTTEALDRDGCAALWGAPAVTGALSTLCAFGGGGAIGAGAAFLTACLTAFRAWTLYRQSASISSVSFPAENNYSPVCPSSAFWYGGTPDSSRHAARRRREVELDAVVHASMQYALLVSLNAEYC